MCVCIKYKSLSSMWYRGKADTVVDDPQSPNYNVYHSLYQNIHY